MFWHIFKKDWKLLWPFFVPVALIQFVPAVIRLKLGLFGEDPVLEYALIPATTIAIFAIAFLCVAIVQQDSLPGIRQDWLIRPIKRRDLLLAKLLFIFAVVEGAAVLAGIFQVLASGFSPHDAVAAAVFQTLFLIAVFTLPALALASVTTTTVECIIGGIVMYLGGAAFLIGFAVAHGGDERLASFGTGAAWITQSAVLLLLLLGAGAVLCLQYYQRKTLTARGMIAISTALFVCVLEFLPWQTAFAVQQRFSPSPGVAHPIALSFEPSLGKYQQPSGINLSDAQAWKRLHREGSPTEVFFPLRITGIPDDAILRTDKSELRLITANGKVVYRGNGEDLELREEGKSEGQANSHQEIDIPDAAYSRLKSQSLRLEIDYSLTLFRLSSAYAIPALAGDERADQMGWCATQMNESGTAVELRCMKPGNGPSCATAFLENPSAGLRNPSFSACEPNYAPSFVRTNADPISHYGINLRFRDSSGLTHFPVDGSQLPKSQVVLRLYEPQEHFTRRLVISSITLEDWESI